MVYISQTKTIRRFIFGLIGFLGFEVVVAGLNLVLPPDMQRVDQASPVLLDRHGVWLRALSVDGGKWRIRSDLARTDPDFIKHLLAIEDERFYWHQGFDLVAIVRAIVTNSRAGAIVSGGSTITMQTARLLNPKPRTYAAKLIEVVRAVQLELRYSKRDILGIYLSLAPYGGNLEGVRAASLSYFGHEPESLTLGEQATLIALPQAPESRRPDRHPRQILRARHLILQRLGAKGVIKAHQVTEASLEPIAHLRQPFNALAWHTTLRLARGTKGLESTLYTTIDASLQSRLETLAARTALDQGAASSVAIMVVDIKNRAVIASIGSAGLNRSGGWVDMTRAIRSPGSTLKPFIYGFGFEDGIIAPETKINDAPTRFGDYQPEDFDKVFHGEVSVKEALVNSLNVPAVAVMNRLGAANFEARFEGAGVRLYRPKSGFKAAGLALALGGEGIRLEDLAVLYAGLGDHGLVKPLAYTRQQAKLTPYLLGSRLMSAQAADKVMAILRETPPPAGRLPSHLMRSGTRPAFKTGTSYGFRDALAVGIAGGYVVLVWTGRPDGGARADLTGREASAPLLFDVFDQISIPSQISNRITPNRAPSALKTLNAAKLGPSILFPPNGVTLFVEANNLKSDGRFTPIRGLKLSARGTGKASGELSWYVDGVALSRTEQGVIWNPTFEGFYMVKVVDERGLMSQSNVRIKAVASNPNP